MVFSAERLKNKILRALRLGRDAEQNFLSTESTGEAREMVQQVAGSNSYWYVLTGTSDSFQVVEKQRHSRLYTRSHRVRPGTTVITVRMVVIPTNFLVFSITSFLPREKS